MLFLQKKYKHKLFFKIFFRISDFFTINIHNSPLKGHETACDGKKINEIQYTDNNAFLF